MKKTLCLQRKNPTPDLTHVTLRECSLFILCEGGQKISRCFLAGVCVWGGGGGGGGGGSLEFQGS